LRKKYVNAFDHLCYRRMLKISWKDKVTNKQVTERINTNLNFLIGRKKGSWNLLVMYSEDPVIAHMHYYRKENCVVKEPEEDQD